MQLFKNLRALAKTINDTNDSINCGGCCVFAAFAGRMLISLGIPARIRIGADDETVKEFTPCSLNEITYDFTEMDEFREVGIRFGHVIVEFDWRNKKYHFDSTGIFPASDRTRACDFMLFDGHITVEQAEMLASSSRGWNYMFDRSDIPRIRKTFDMFHALLNPTA